MRDPGYTTGNSLSPDNQRSTAAAHWRPALSIQSEFKSGFSLG